MKLQTILVLIVCLINIAKAKDVLIDCVRYINLEKRLDRRKNIEQQLNRFKEMGLLDSQTNVSSLRFRAVEHENRALGCTQSHIGVLQAFIANSCKKWFDIRGRLAI